MTRQLLDELRPGLPRRPVTLDSDFERDLGLDSLCRAELAARIERAMGISLPDDALASAATPREMLAAVAEAAVGSPAQVAGTASARWENATAVSPVGETPTGTLADSATLIEVLDWQANVRPEFVQIVCMSDGGDLPISYRELRRQADAIAGGLQRAGLEARQTVAIMLPTCPEYFYTYFGVLRAGGIPVPIYPPARLSQVEEHVGRHAGILSNAGTTVLVTVPAARSVARLLEARVAGLRRVTTVGELTSATGTPQQVPIVAEDTAFIQYTSGSTGAPKGVVLSHANLLANIRGIGQTIDVGPEDVFVSWLPLYHDMGLICAWLTSLYFARPLVVMSPLAFLARPERWLRAIEHYRGTISAAPNFAYELCVKRIDDARIVGLDLSAWRIAANGAEPVMPETMTRFCERFAGFGFRATAMTPVYGLAENSVGLLCPPLGRGPRIDRVRRAPFSRDGAAEPDSGNDAAALRFVSCGRPLAGHQVRIVDALGQELGERREGRLEFKGPSATAGYFRNPEETRRLFDGDWLDTGDRAYIADGEVYLTGRVKDIIIRGGRNIYPHEVEDAVGNIAGVRRGCVAVFGCPDPDSGTERLVVLAETRESSAEARDALRAHIVEATVTALGEPPDEVVLAPPQTVLKTSSGKIRRTACRELYAAGRVGKARHAGWWQVVRLLSESLLPAARRLATASAEHLYGAYAWLWFALLSPPTWLFTLLAPNAAAAWRVNRRAARLLFKLTRIRLLVEGLEHLPAGPCVLVANHASYVDGLALLAALPIPFSFVAKREFLDQAMARPYLRRLGVVFVGRFETRQSLADAGQLTEALKAGRSLASFPEGTFRWAAGLASFRLGAFAAAVAANAQVLPVSIRGSRQVLRDEHWLPRRGVIAVTIGQALTPPAAAPDAFAAALALSNEARRHILAHCGEPDAGTG